MPLTKRQLALANFGRGPDKQPRKRKLIGAVKTAAGVGASGAITGLGIAGTGATLGLMARPQDALLQSRLARGGLVVGSLYGGYKGIKRARQKAREENSRNKSMTRFREGGNIARFRDTDTELLSESEYNRELFDLTVENIRNAVDADILTPEEGEEAELDAINEYNAIVAEELGYDVEDIDEDDEYEDEEDEEEEEYEEYSDGSEMAYFEAGNGFSSGLVELFDAAGYDDLAEGVVDLAEVLGLDEEDAAGLLTGDFVPHPDLVEQIADAFDLDDSTYAQLDYLGEEARSDAGYVDEDVEDEDVLEEAVENTAAYSRIENQLAEFQAEAILKDELAEFERDCNRGFEEGWLPPVVYRDIMGSFESESDRLAAFSALCTNSGVDAATQLFGFRSVLQAFYNCGPLMTFSSVVDEPLDPREAEQEYVSASQAELNFRLRKQRSSR
jgi:hypothetical protein